MRQRAFRATLLILSFIGVSAAADAFAQNQDVRKDATAATKTANSTLLDELPFSDKSDFDSARKGLIALLPTEMIKGQAGNAIWNPEQFKFIADGAATPDTVNPSL